MSKQEVLTWTSLATSLSALIFYVLLVFDWPAFVPDYSGDLFKLAFRIFLIALVVEIAVGIFEGNKKVDKDERDFIIEAKGLKVGYNMIVISMMIALTQVFISNVTQNYITDSSFGIEIIDIFHFLFIALFVSSAAKRITMLYNYRK